MFVFVTAALAYSPDDTGALLDCAAGFAPDTGGCGADRLVTFAPQGEDIPVEVVLTAFFSDCGGASVEHQAIVVVDGDEELHSNLDGGEDGAFTWATVPYTPEAGQQIEVTLTHASTQDQVVSFTTSDAAFEPISTGPTFEQVDWQTDALPWIQVTAEESPYGPTFVEARKDSGAVAATGINEVGRSTLRTQSWGGGELCLTLFQRDADGSWLEGDSFCEEEPPRCGGCSSGVGAGSALAAMAAALLLRRRRG